MIKLLVADDHALVRKGIVEIVNDADGITVTGEAGNGHEVLARISENRYDVVVLDIGMPGMSGLDVLKEIKRENPELPVLILSIYPEEQYAVRAFKSGASGYLTKKSSPNELVRAIRKVHKGGKYVSSSLGEKLALYLDDREDKPLHETLSDREYQVMIMLAQGKKLKDIASEFYLSEKTVSTYRSRVLEKMRMKDNTELTRYAINKSLIE